MFKAGNPGPTKGRKLHKWSTAYVPDPRYKGRIPRLEWTCTRPGCGQKKHGWREKVPDCVGAR